MTKEQLKAQAKALLDEKLSDEELDGVAGGSFDENQDVLIAMMNVDPQGTMKLLKEWDQRSETAKGSLNDKLTTLINKNFGKDGVVFAGSADQVSNMYFINGKNVSHQQFINFLNTTASVSQRRRRLVKPNPARSRHKQKSLDSTSGLFFCRDSVKLDAKSFGGLGS